MLRRLGFPRFKGVSSTRNSNRAVGIAAIRSSGLIPGDGIGSWRCGASASPDQPDGAQVLPKFGRECFRPSSDRSDRHRDGISFVLFLGTDVALMHAEEQNRIRQ
jgi:hypothetical protein